VVVVAVFSLMSASEVAEHGRDAIGCDGAFVHSGHCRGVVASRYDGAVADVGSLGDEADLRKLAGLFQVTVCDGAFRVIKRDQVFLDVVGKGLSPDMWGTIVIVVDPSHARFCRIRGAKEGWFLRHYFRLVCGPVREAGC
jgi:hypothetical protein